MERAEAQTRRPPGAASQSEIDLAKNQLALERLLLDARAHDLELATIKAPVDGVVGTMNITPGQFLTKGASLTTIVGLSSAYLTLSVPVSMLPHLHPGQSLRFKPQFRDPVQAEITYIVPVVNNGFVKLKAYLTGNTDNLLPGTPGTAVFTPDK